MYKCAHVLCLSISTGSNIGIVGAKALADALSKNTVVSLLSLACVSRPLWAIGLDVPLLFFESISRRSPSQGPTVLRHGINPDVPLSRWEIRNEDFSKKMSAYERVVNAPGLHTVSRNLF